MPQPNSYQQDEQGQWWLYFKGGARTRAVIRSCEICGTEYPSRGKRRFCSERCQYGDTQRAKRTCEWCRKRLRGKKSQRYCSHVCAASAMHAGKVPTTQDETGPLINADNSRYSRDGSGQWWYRPSGTRAHGQPWPRTRAYVKVCRQCGRRFLSNIFHQKRQGSCSRTCGMRAFHKEHPQIRAREKSTRWAGGTLVNRSGYVMELAPDHPSLDGTQRRYVLQHRLVMESVLGRLLARNEYVHHKNGDRADNRPENLELWRRGQPPGQRAEEAPHCPTCTCHRAPA